MNSRLNFCLSLVEVKPTHWAAAIPIRKKKYVYQLNNKIVQTMEENVYAAKFIVANIFGM